MRFKGFSSTAASKKIKQYKIILVMLIFAFFYTSLYSQIDIDIDEVTKEKIKPPVKPLPPEKEETTIQKSLPKRGYTIKIKKDEKGWVLLINGEATLVKGFTYGPTPIGENYSFNLWSQPDSYIKKVLDTDCQLMKEMGANAIRLTPGVPPKWIKYIYKKYGIYTVINDFMGRYGLTVDGVWMFPTDYSDPRVKKALVESAIQTVKTYKDVPGILMFLFGNENNYGLEWKTTEIENLPVGERERAKAKYLYSVWGEVCKNAKKVAPDVPVGIVNGEVQYIDLAKKYCGPYIDIFGANVYRGERATILFEQVKNGIDKPFLFTEFGCDAYNVKLGHEDQYYQTLFIKSQWQEIYHKLYGHNEEANCLGGLVFEWIDEWWKKGQSYDLYIHNPEGSWSHPAYYFDYMKSEHSESEWTGKLENMNEEWWGIVAQSENKIDGINQRIPRGAYYLLKDIWNNIDPFKMSIKEIDDYFAKMNILSYINKGEINSIKANLSENMVPKFRIKSGKIVAEWVGYGTDTSIKSNKKEGLTLSDGEMVFIDFAFNPYNNLKGSISLNILGNIANKPVTEIYYGNRGEPYTVLITTNQVIANLNPTDKKIVNDNERVEIYSFDAKYTGDVMDFNIFYHMGHYHWMYEGDFFGLNQEANDIPQYDVYNSKPPFGFEMIGKKSFDGIKILAGPEVYWGANPKILLKYYKNFDTTTFAIIHSEDLKKREKSSGAVAAKPVTRATSLYLKFVDIPIFNSLEIGAIMSGTEKIGDDYLIAEETSPGTGYLNSGWKITENNSVKFVDTLGGKILGIASLAHGINTFAQFIYQGIVADGGNIPPGIIPGTQGSLIYDPGTGNRMEARAGLHFIFGDIQFVPNFLYRKPLKGPLPEIEGQVISGKVYPSVGPRNIYTSPFAVVGNREARIYEVIFTYEPTGATWFYDWNNDDLEDAELAFNIVFNYAEYPTFTDAGTFVMEDGSSAAFGHGLPSANVWQVGSRIVSKFATDSKIIARISSGKQQCWGEDPRLVQFFTADIIGKIGNWLLKSYFKKDAWGPFDYYKWFNITFPMQLMLDVSYTFNEFPVLVQAAPRCKVGFKGLYRTFDEYSKSVLFDNNLAKAELELGFYSEINF